MRTLGQIISMCLVSWFLTTRLLPTVSDYPFVMSFISAFVGGLLLALVAQFTRVQFVRLMPFVALITWLLTLDMASWTVDYALTLALSAFVSVQFVPFAFFVLFGRPSGE